MRARDIPVILGFALAVMVLNVLASFVVVWLYSTFVEPGHPEAFYQEFALRAAPVSSVVAGIPLMFAAGFAVAGARSPRHGLIGAAAIACLYIAADAAILLAANIGPGSWTWELLSYPTKLLAAVAGAAVRGKSRRLSG